MLQDRNGRSFVSSRTKYLDTIPGYRENRIVIRVKFADLHEDFAVVDTGAPFCILSREQAEVYDPDYRDTGIENKALIIRDSIEEGILVRWPITLLAEEGDDITVESTIFIPDDYPSIPNFIGLTGLLCRIRFAVDPGKNHFFFGSAANHVP